MSVGGTRVGASDQERGEMVKDSVCGMSIEPRKAAAHREYGGKIYYFCSDDCYGKFIADPEGYTK